MTTPSGDLITVAIQRGNEQVPPGGVDLSAGDVLLLVWKTPSAIHGTQREPLRRAHDSHNLTRLPAGVMVEAFRVYGITDFITAVGLAPH